jgi:O-antigen/teichoic acid export membrane protein
LIVIQFVSLLITNRLLGSGGRGLFVSASTWAVFLFTFFYLSINTMYLKECAENKGNKEDLKNGFFSFAVLLSLVCMFIAIIIYLLFNSRFIQLPFNIYFINILTIPGMIFQSLALSVYQSDNDFKKVNIVTLFTAASNFIFILTAILFTHFNVLIFSVISLTSWSLCALYCYITCRFKFSRHALKMLFYRNFVNDISYLHINTIMSFLVSGFNIILMHKYVSDDEVGQFFLANSIIGYLLILPISIQNVLIANLINRTNIEKAKLTGYFYKATLFGMIIIGILLFLFSDLIVLILGGKTFIHSAFYLQCLIISAVFQIAGIMWSSLWNIRGYFKTITKLSILIVLLSILLNFILIKKMGVTGAVITSAVITFLSMCVHLILAMREYKKTGISRAEIFPHKNDFIFLKENLNRFKYRFRKNRTGYEEIKIDRIM